MPIAETTSENLYLSELAPGSVQSEIRAMTVACADLNGINMAQGVCDTDPPHPVVEAAIAAIRSGQNIYTRMEGILPLREGIARKFASFNGLEVDPVREVIVTSGATGALHAAVMALLNPGDECLVLEPFYGYHVSTLLSQSEAGGGGDGGSRVDAGCGAVAGGGDGEDAGDHSEQSVESFREGFYAGRD